MIVSPILFCTSTSDFPTLFLYLQPERDTHFGQSLSSPILSIVGSKPPGFGLVPIPRHCFMSDHVKPETKNSLSSRSLGWFQEGVVQ